MTALTRPFRQFGVPHDANFIGKATIGIAGIPGENVVIENYNGQFRDGTKYFGDVTYPDCIPVSRGVYYESGLSLDRYAVFHFCLHMVVFRFAFYTKSYDSISGFTIKKLELQTPWYSFHIRNVQKNYLVLE